MSLDEIVFFKSNVYILFCFLAMVGDPGPWGLDPGFRVKKIPDPGSASKNLSKKFVQDVGNMIRDVHSVSESRIWMLIFTDPGSRGQRGTGSRIRNTDYSKGAPLCLYTE
jgi:hypothetical protein